jgi:hypothetical protein
MPTKEEAYSQIAALGERFHEKLSSRVDSKAAFRHTKRSI